MRRRKVTGHRSNGRGTPQIDRMFPLPVGEIRRASGTHDAEAFRDINDMLTALCRSVPPRWDVLLAIRDRRIEPLHALSLWRMNKLEEVPSAEVLPLLQSAYDSWHSELEHSEAYKGQIASTFGKLLAMHSEAVTIGDIAELLQQRRAECKEAGSSVGFNRSKAHVQTFIRDTLGDDHQLYRAVTKIPTLPVTNEVERRAMQPRALAEHLAELPKDDALCAWSLAVSGMRPKEYFTRAWHVADGKLAVRHGKTQAARRNVPLWSPLPVLVQRTRSAFEGMWERRLGDRLGIYDLRRSFAVWMEDANIPRSRRKIYLGHSAGDVTGLYEQRELDGWLRDDATRLQHYAWDVLGAIVADIHPDRARVSVWFEELTLQSA